MTDTSGPTPVVITTDGKVVVAPASEAQQAFDLVTGAPTTVPAGLAIPTSDTSEGLPPGYALDGNKLTYNGTSIWSEPATAGLFVARLGVLTIINDTDQGLRVVDDDGVILAAPSFGRREYDAVPILVDGTVAVTVAADGMLYAVGAAHA